MPKPTPLQTLIELSQTRLDDATRQLGQLLASERADEEKLVLLNNYRQEYQNRFLAAAQEGMGPEAWRNYQSFLGKLDEAVEHQSRIVTQAKARSTAGQQSWLAERTKVQAYDKLHQRAMARETSREYRQEQKAADEHSVKNFLGRTEDE